jgi:signal transduction histidine kinase
MLLLGLSVVPFDLVLPLVMPNIKEVNLLPIQALVTVISLGFVFGLGSAADLEIQRIQTAQIVNANRIRWNTARFYATHWFQKRQYARKLHGPMQAEILAHVIRLEQSLVAGDSAQPPALNSRADLEAKLLELLNAPRVDLRPDEVLADLAETWEGICTIDVSFDEGLPQALIQDQIACETVLEIIREATSNAIQHGGATEIRVCVASGIEDCVSLTVTDNGSGVGDDSGEKGQGSRYLEECTVEYALESGSFGASLTAKIPLSCPSSQELQVA